MIFSAEENKQIIQKKNAKSDQFNYDDPHLAIFLKIPTS